jgi:hypothetical protein
MQVIWLPRETMFTYTIQVGLETDVIVYLNCGWVP